MEIAHPDRDFEAANKPCHVLLDALIAGCGESPPGMFGRLPGTSRLSLEVMAFQVPHRIVGEEFIQLGDAGCERADIAFEAKQRGHVRSRSRSVGEFGGAVHPLAVKVIRMFIAQGILFHLGIKSRAAVAGEIGGPVGGEVPRVVGIRQHKNLLVDVTIECPELRGTAIDVGENGRRGEEAV